MVDPSSPPVTCPAQFRSAAWTPGRACRWRSLRAGAPIWRALGRAWRRSARRTRWPARVGGGGPRWKGYCRSPRRGQGRGRGREPRAWCSVGSAPGLSRGSEPAPCVPHSFGHPRGAAVRSSRDPPGAPWAAGATPHPAHAVPGRKRSPRNRSRVLHSGPPRAESPRSQTFPTVELPMEAPLLQGRGDFPPTASEVTKFPRLVCAPQIFLPRTRSPQGAPTALQVRRRRNSATLGPAGHAGAETLILKGGPCRHPRDLRADPMASPWPALRLLSITCCSCSRCVPGRINSRPGRAGGGGGVQRPAGDGARNSASPPPARSLRLWPRHVLLFFRGRSGSSPRAPSLPGRALPSWALRTSVSRRRDAHPAGRPRACPGSLSTFPSRSFSTRCQAQF